MRTTVTVDDHLLRQAKEEAVRTGHTLGYVVEEALRERFARRQIRARRKRLPVFTTSGEGGLAPGVDLDDTSALLDLMEDR